MDPSTPYPAPVNAPEPVPPKPARKSQKLLITLSCLLLLAGAATAVWLLVINKSGVPAKSATVQPASASAAVSYVPRFNAINSKVEYKNAAWYVTNGGVVRIAAGKAEFYSNSEGVPLGIPQNMVVYNGRLWLATQQGVAYLNEGGNGFVASKIDGAPSDFSNGKLFYDASGKKLYATGFEAFYAYNDKTSKWETIAGVGNVQSFAANDKFIALYAARPGWPIWMYDKTTKKWEVKNPALEEQTGTVFGAGTNIFVVGRSTGYTSCASAGKVTATSAFRVDSTGSWQPVAGFNEDKARPELTVLKSATGAVNLKSSPCNSTNKPKTYQLAYSGDGFTLKELDIAPDSQTGLLESVDEQTKLIAEITKASGLHPSMHVLDVDGKGNVIFGYSDAFSGSSVTTEPFIAIAKGGSLTDATVLDMKSLVDRENYPVMCGQGAERQLQYVFSGVEHIAQTAHEGFPDGFWGSAKLYSVDGSKLTEVLDMGDEVSVPKFACTDTQLAWAGKTGLRRMERSTNKVTQVGDKFSQNLQYKGAGAASTATGNLWFSINSETVNASTLYFYDAVKGTYAVVAAKINASSLSAATDTHVIVDSSQDKSAAQAVYDRSGKQVQLLGVPSPVAYDAATDSFVRVADEDTQSSLRAYDITRFKVGTAAEKLDVTKNGFVTRYDTNGLGFFGLYLRPGLVYDSSRQQVWLNDDSFGIKAIKVVYE